MIIDMKFHPGLWYISTIDGLWLWLLAYPYHKPVLTYPDNERHLAQGRIWRDFMGSSQGRTVSQSFSEKRRAWFSPSLPLMFLAYHYHWWFFVYPHHERRVSFPIPTIRMHPYHWWFLGRLRRRRRDFWLLGAPLPRRWRVPSTSDTVGGGSNCR